MKLLVLIFCVVTVQSYESRYCQICHNHTLCKYPVAGPTAACRNFDKEATLSDTDIKEIVNRINARRNLVAVGRLKNFPPAANMRKVQWSNELASFAQRWADQCDPSVRPNKEDECRDLEGMEVGQTIAAVVGPAPGLSVKSFVDMWFMLKFHYTGSVVYYNQSRDAGTNYFTQLIWAKNEYVGCGKIKFFNQNVSTIVERLICNFAPRGNDHGKPVYTVGFPATQCPKSMLPDLEFPGLCKQDHEKGPKIVLNSSESRLLRILYSSNSSAKQDLDSNSLRQARYNGSNIKDQRNQKTRQAYINNNNGAKKRDSSHIQNPHPNPMNEIDFKDHSFTPERGHSRMYHGHFTKIEPIHNFQTMQSLAEQDIRKFDRITTFDPLSIQHNRDYASYGARLINNKNEFITNNRRININHNDFVPDQSDYASNGRRHYGEQVCTRKPKCVDCFSKLCTRGQSHSCDSCLKSQSYSSCLLPPLPPAPLNHDFCACKAKISCLPIPSPICPICQSHDCVPEPTSCCALRRAQSEIRDATKNTQYSYYDLFPNIRLRSANENQQKHFNNYQIEDSLQHEDKAFIRNNQVTESTDYLQITLQQPQDSHDIFYSSKRNKRDSKDQIEFKPFWQMDEYNIKRPSELKSLRYTTLADKRIRKSRWTTTHMKLPITESITIKLDEKLIHDKSYNDLNTEKYLSFEELMQLRKLSTLETLDYEIRRFGNQALRQKGNKDHTSTKPQNIKTNKDKSQTKGTMVTTRQKTPGITTTQKPSSFTTTQKSPSVTTTQKPPSTTTTKKMSNTADIITPYIDTSYSKIKQCTRKITCTWTALITGVDGSIVGNSVNAPNVESRTDDCTRTSTCTREFKNRNIMPVQTTEYDSYSNNSPNDYSSQEDEEYCERRSLNVQRREIDSTDKMLSIESHGTLTRLIPSTTEMSQDIMSYVKK